MLKCKINIHCLIRQERQNFIRTKYIDRHFYIAEESPDQEFQAVMKNRPPGEDEDELFNDSAEVIHVWFKNLSTRLA